MATDRLGDMRLFAEAASAGSLSAAGRKLGLSPAAASARLARLEAALLAKLFDRTSRQLQLTDEGHTYLAHCTAALKIIDDAQAELQAGQGVVRGKLRISASTDFGRHLLDRWLDAFIDAHPEVRVSLTLTDSLSNLHQDKVDLAIRFGEPENSALVARRLAPNCRVLCASPEYVERHGAPSTPEDLEHHRFIVLVTGSGPLNEFHFARGEQTWQYTVPMADAWESNDGGLVRTWTLAGRGIARKTIWDAAEDVRAGRLRILLPEYVARESGVYAIRHNTRYMAPRVRALLDFLIEQFAREAVALRDVLPHAE